MTRTSGWIYRAEKEAPERGVQIDLVIDRADNCINICEIKYSNDTFVIDKAYEKDLRQRKAIFIEKMQTKKAVFLTFITLYGVSKEAGYFGVVDREITMNELFLPLRRLNS